MSEFEEITQLELLETAPEIIRELVTAIKRTDSHWEMSKTYSAAVQWLKKYDASSA